MGRPPKTRGRRRRLLTLALLALGAGLLVLGPAAGFPGDNGGIAFTRSGEIWVMNADGSSPTQLTSGGGTAPAFSDDAARIAFIRGANVHTMVSDGTDVVQRTTEGGGDPAWSDDGAQIAFTRGGEVWVMDADGSEQAALTSGGGADPAWSPEGGRIAFTRGGEVWVMNADGGSPVAVTSGGGSEPAWSPDGERIAFTRGSEVWLVNADGGSPAALTAGADPTWSPDGTKIAFTRGSEVWVVNVDGTGEGPLTSGGGSEPDWGVGAEPDDVALPTITGSASQGSTLTAGRGSWASSSPLTFVYQWQRCDAAGAACTAIDGATGTSYTLTASEVGSTVRVVVTATNAFGSTTVESAVTAVVAASGAPVNTVAPTISGTPSVGTTLASTEGTWTGTGITFTRQWQRCDTSGGACTAITGATGTHYVVGTADVGRTLRISVRATNAQGSATVMSAATAVVAATAPSNTAPPSISGTPRVGSFLSLFRGGWSGTGISFTQQWQRCDASGGNCANIVGATSTSYTPTSSDVGSRIRAVVTASNQAGTQMVASAPTAAVTAATTTTTTGTATTSTFPRNVTRPRITGTPVQGSTLTASAGSWTGTSPLTYTYQWERCDDEDEEECEEIAGATRSTYSLASRDVGSRIRVQVTARNSAGDETEASDATEVVRATGAGGSGTGTTGSQSGTTARTMRGTARADVLLGSSGNDRFLPGRGADTVVAGEGDDVIEAADGVRDVIVCGPGRDRVTADRIDVLRECEVVRYVASGRTLRGTRRAEILVAGNGNDTILPGGGADTIVAGPGDDVVFAVDGARDVVACGEGRDRVTADRRDALHGCEVVRRVGPKR